MRKALSSVIVALMLSCISPSLHAQTPAQEPVLPAPKLNLTLEQRHVIREIIKEAKPQPAAGDFRVEVGEAIPASVNPQPMPNEVAQKVPQVKSHRFFVVDDQIVIVDPKDGKVADIIKLGGD